MRKYILTVCHEAFVMSESVKAEVASTFGVRADKLVVTPHGHYVNAYARKGKDIRKQFGISPDSFLCLFIGRINPYKGVDQLVEAYAQLGQGGCELLVAGHVDSGYDLDFIDRVNDGTIHLYPQFVDDLELADYLEAANVIVLPYKQITTSGSAILALSHKKPVVAPRLGALGDTYPRDAESCTIRTIPKGCSRRSACPWRWTRRKRRCISRRSYGNWIGAG